MSLPFKLQHVCLLSGNTLVLLPSSSAFLECVAWRMQRGRSTNDMEEEHDVSSISSTVSRVLFIEMYVLLVVSPLSGIRYGYSF